MTTTTSSSLPAWPSENARKSLTPSQHATLYQNVSAALSHILALPHDKRDDDSVNRFISSYAKDAALQVLEGLVWNKDTSQDNVKKSVRKKVLVLAESYSTTHGIDAQTLLDLAVAYGTNPSKISSKISPKSPALTAPNVTQRATRVAANLILQVLQGNPVCLADTKLR